MKDHIIDILEQSNVANLSRQQLSIIEAHISNCPKCLQAYEAALLSESMLKALVSQTLEPSPFFKSRVMAALKQKQNGPEPSPFLRLWGSVSILIFSMVAVVALLLTLTIFNMYSFSQTEPPKSASIQNPYSTERLLIEEDNEDNNMTESQVLVTLYDSEDINGNH